MNPKPIRRFTIADIMILAVAVAVATLLLRSYMPGHYSELMLIEFDVDDPWGLWRLSNWVSGPPTCLAIPAMAALIAIRLRKPRPRRSRLVNQPGFIACLAVMLTLVPGLLWYLTIRHRPGFQQADDFDKSWAIVTQWEGTAVLGSWLALALSRRWRPEPSWIDRTGRVLGLYWIVFLIWVLARQVLHRLYA